MGDRILRVSGHHLDRLVLYYNNYESLRRSMEILGIYDESTLKKIPNFFRALLKNPDTRMQVVEGEDDVCNLCSYKKKCSTTRQDEVDGKYLEHYGLNRGDIITVRDAILNYVFWKTTITIPQKLTA